MWGSWSQSLSWSPEPGSSVAVVAEEEEAVEDTSDTEVEAEAEDSSWVVDTVQDTAGSQFCWDTDRQSLDQDYPVLSES